MSESPELVYDYDRITGEYVITRADHHVLTKEDAQEIIHRRNCHDDLIKACEKGLEMTKWARRILPLRTDGHKKAGEYIKQIESILAKAQKQGS